MGAQFGDDTISRIRSLADIVEVVSGRVTLKKAGRNFLGLCPFHAEKTPSFSVNPLRQSFHCFGCGEGGDVFDFVMKSDGLTFPEAVAALGDRFGVEVASFQIKGAKSARSDREAIFSANRQAADFFTSCLKTPGGAGAREYLDRRKVGARAIEAFGLGFAPEGWHSLDTHLKSRGISAVIINKSGLLSKNDAGRVYDRFRNRLMFPITDVRGQVAGFGGRTMTDETPKYLNSPQSPVYDKKRVLYGIQQALGAVRREKAIFVVEGYLDVIAMWEAGIENTVATCGTALSSEHVRQLKNLADSIVLVFDADRAGIAAAVRSVPIFMAEKAQAKVICLPPGHDPDTFVREKGPDAFLKLARKADDLVRFMMDEAISRHGLSITGKTRVVEELKSSLAMIEDPVARSLYIRELSQKLGVDEAAVLSHVARADRENRPATENPGLPEAPEARQDNPLERRIVEAMLVSQEFLEDVKSSAFIEEFENETLKEIGKTLITLGPEASRSDLMSFFDRADQRCMVAEIFAKSVPAEPDGCRLILASFEKTLIKKRLRKLSAAIREAFERGDEDAQQELSAEQSMLQRNLRFQQ